LQKGTLGDWVKKRGRNSLKRPIRGKRVTGESGRVGTRRGGRGKSKDLSREKTWLDGG